MFLTDEDGDKYVGNDNLPNVVSCCPANSDGDQNPQVDKEYNGEQPAIDVEDVVPKVA